MQAKNEIILQEIYFDTERQGYVRLDSIQNTKKGPYAHYQYCDSKQWGRKSIKVFLQRFTLTMPLGSTDLKQSTIEATSKVKAPKKHTVSNKYNNVIYVDFVNKKVIEY